MLRTILLLTILNIGLLFSKYNLVKIYYQTDEEFNKILSLNLDLESAKDFKNEIEIIVNDFEKDKIAKSGLKYNILNEDYESFLEKKILEQQEKINENIPLGFTFGSMGGFYTLDEIYREFEKLSNNYNHLVEIDTIGFSWEKNPIIAYCFGSSDTTKPEVLLTALHHSREPATVTTIVYFLQTLFSKAKEGNQEALYLLNNRRIWIIPVLNPDGYLYNQKRYPKGGGLWRKNRRPINDSTFGVDLNRNYGPFEFWNANNNGSSTNPQNETYRGPEPFSEPEIVALRNFCFSRKFSLALNYHTYGGMLIYPYSALPYETPDSNWFRNFGMYIQQFNSYYFGTDKQTVGYPTRGSSDDWFYTIDSTKGKVFAFSPEASYQFDGFWPDKNRIIPIAQENYPILLNLLWSADVNVVLADYFYDFDTTRKIGFLNLEFQNLGINPSEDNLPVQIRSKDETFPFDTTIYLTSLYPASKIHSEIRLPIPNENFINGSNVSFLVSVLQDGIERNDTIGLTLYEYEIINLKDSSFWDFSNSNWGYELNSETQSLLLCDSPLRNYKDSSENFLYLNKPIQLNGINFQLEIQSRWSIEPFYDFAKIELSTTGGKDWIPLRFKRSTIASGNQYGKQKLGEFGFAGYFPYWNRQIANLKDYLGKDIYLRLSLLSDRAKNSSGWDIKEIQLRKYPFVDFKNYINVENDTKYLILHINGSLKSKIPIEKGLVMENISIFDILGRTIFSKKLTENELFLNLPSLPSGIFFVIIKSNKGYYFEKVISN